MPPIDKSLKLQIIVAALFVVTYGVLSSFYKIEPSQQGVVTRFGAFSHFADEGPHLALPFGIDQVYKIEVTRIHEMQFGFRKGFSLSKEQARRESLMLTGDLNVAVVEWILQYKIEDPKKFSFHAKNVEKNIQDVSISVMRRVVGDKQVGDVLTKDRVEIASTAKKLTQETLDLYDMGILIIKVSLQNVTPPEQVRPAYNEINIAKQEKEQMINEAEETYNKVIPEAEGLAQKKITESEAYAINILNKAEGDSQKFKEIYKAYKVSPAATKKRLYIETIEKVFNKLEGVTIIDEKVKGVLPILGQMDLGKELSLPGQKGSSAKLSSNIGGRYK